MTGHIYNKTAVTPVFSTCLGLPQIMYCGKLVSLPLLYEMDHNLGFHPHFAVTCDRIHVDGNTHVRYV